MFQCKSSSTWNYSVPIRATGNSTVGRARWKASDIATKLNRSRRVVLCFSRDPEAYDTNRYGKQSFLSNRAMRPAGRVVHQKLSAFTSGGRYLNDWFFLLFMRVLPRAAYSSDLNPVENTCGLVARAVYGSARQYDTVSYLMQATVLGWSAIIITLVQWCITSMRTSFIRVVQILSDKVSYW